VAVVEEDGAAVGEARDVSADRRAELRGDLPHLSL